MSLPSRLVPSGPSGSRGRWVVLALISMSALLVLGLITAPMAMFAGGGIMSMGGDACRDARGAPQPSASGTARNSIPADYLALFKSIGAKYGVPWVILAGIGKVESDDGQSNLPGVHSGANAFGAAGPMQIGIGGAAGNTWGGAPVHPASEVVSGVATDANGDGIASVYEPADAIAGAAKYLLAHGVLSNVQSAIFAYNHLTSYVQTVMSWASTYASGGYSVSPVTLDNAPGCLPGSGGVPNTAVAAAIAFAESQLGKPYLWGGTGPDAFDCSGLVMASYLAAGIDIPRTSEQQWSWGPRVSPGQVQPGDLVFFAGSDGTVQSPGHVGLVVAPGKMIEAYAPGFPIRIASFGTASAAPGDGDPVGFTRPWAHPGVRLAAVRTAAG